MADGRFPGEAKFLLSMGEHDREWLKQDMDDIALGDLPEWLSRNGTLITQGVREKLTRRCGRMYDELFERYSPDGLLGYGTNDYRQYLIDMGTPEEELPEEFTEEGWLRERDEFFSTVRKLDSFKFRDAGCPAGIGVRGESVLLQSELARELPGYAEWALQDSIERIGENVKARGGHWPGDLSGLDLSKQVAAPVQAEPAPAKGSKSAGKPAKQGGSAPSRRRGDELPEFDPEYDIPDEYEERRRNSGDLGDQ